MEVKLQILDARAAHEVEASLAGTDSQRASALYVSLDPLFLEHRARIVDLAAKERLPALYDVKEFVLAGGLMSYGPDLADLFRRPDSKRR